MAQQSRRPSVATRSRANKTLAGAVKVETRAKEHVADLMKTLSASGVTLSGIKENVAAIGSSSSPGAAETTGLNAGGLAAGIDALARVTEIPFPEFTAKLVNSTFDAIIAATIRQMEAYADLVANLAKTIQEFEAGNVTDAEVTKYLSDSYPDGQGGTSVRDSFDFDSEADLGKVFGDLVNVRLASIWNEAGPTKPAGPIAGTKRFDKNQIVQTQAGVRRFLATSLLDNLRLMAREGMARIVVKQGRIRSSLTFNVSSTDEQAASSAQYNQQQFSASIRGRAGWGWGSVRAGADYTSLNVRTQNERTFNKVTMDATIVGEVELNFQTESFPAIASIQTPAS